jgi:hypothetical protein
MFDALRRPAARCFETPLAQYGRNKFVSARLKSDQGPAVVPFVNKFESLCRSDARFSAAYKVCQERAAS